MISSTPTRTESQAPASTLSLLAYLLAGTFFGVVLVKSEAASWYRIQEMFHFQSFHMYGLIGSAVLTGMLTTGLLRHFRARSLDGQAIKIQHKAPGLPRYVFGGLTFGLGWGLAGVCPGPIFTLLGSGIWAMLIVLLFALIGTWLYGVLRNRLPH
ncbi:DUF6691 family protein [Deinococcus psychrotolerans]|nr:DUF6691 family protein [Deinococcus psychrotolerans]